MKQLERMPCLIAAAVLAATLALLPGCQKIRERVFLVPEGVAQRSYVIRANGYEQTVDVKATTEELTEFLSDPSSSYIYESGEEGSSSSDQGWDYEEQPFVTGAVYPQPVKSGPVVIPGRVIVLKLDQSNIWVAWDSTQAVALFRWNSLGLGQGCRIGFDTFSIIRPESILGKLEDLPGVEEAGTETLKWNDLMLARIQAHFDPSLDPHELVSIGLRGNDYKALLQVREAKEWVNAFPRKLEKWLMDPENAHLWAPEFEVQEEEYFIKLPKLSKEGLTHAPATFKTGDLVQEAHVFTLKKKKRMGKWIRTYVVSGAVMGLIELEVAPRADGSILTYKMIWEIPRVASAEDMELMLFLSELPQRLEQRMLAIKQGVEKQHET